MCAGMGYGATIQCTVPEGSGSTNLTVLYRGLVGTAPFSYEPGPIAAGDTAAVEVVTHGTVGSIAPGAALQSRDANNSAFGSMVNSTLVVGDSPDATGFIAPASSDGVGLRAAGSQSWTTTGVSFYGFVNGSIGVCDRCTFPYQETQGVFVTHSSRTTLAEGSRYV